MQQSYYRYPVEFADDVFGASPVLAEILEQVRGEKPEKPKVLLVADANVVQRTEGLGVKIGKYVQEHQIRLAGKALVLSGGQKMKGDGLKSALKVAAAILEAKLGHDDIVLALGGGSLQDVVGYVAAQTRGGVGVVRIPTTPAAMMDGAFAAYAAVDSATVKDALRIPCEPTAVVIDVSFARTVLDGVWRAGIGEAVRQAVAADAALVKSLKELAPKFASRELADLEKIVRLTVESRLSKGGSTFGLWAAFRLETMSEYKLPHGYALAVGILLDTAYAVEKGFLDAEAQTAVRALVDALALKDGIVHSRPSLEKPEVLLCGLDAWNLASREASLEIPDALGHTRVEKEIDKETMKKAIDLVKYTL